MAVAGTAILVELSQSRQVNRSKQRQGRGAVSPDEAEGADARKQEHEVPEAALVMLKGDGPAQSKRKAAVAAPKNDTVEEYKRSC